ncbi:MAG TPA: SPFH domain-containing protein [Roseiflexaceae bacterium]|nr:SPFH domain-containing protein [Roseiflexaceae bacterium]
MLVDGAANLLLQLLLFLVGLFVLVRIVFLWVRLIPNNRVGIVEKRFGGKSLHSGFIAMQGEAGFQPYMLRGGVHFLTPIQYAVHSVPLVTIPQGKIGYLFARDGQPLEATQTLASNAKANDFQDAVAFLKNGGQRGPQRLLLREGTYAINLAQFIVITEERVYSLPLSREDEEIIKRMAMVIAERDGFKPVVIKGTDDVVGVVTIHDGPALPQGEIIAPTVGDDPLAQHAYHNNFQDPDKFLRAGGYRGRQLQVLTEGTYYINRLFGTVEMIAKTVVEVGNVGVVVSYTGEQGTDISGTEYKHGELVQKGQRGVWSTPLLPGKYAFNTYAGKVIMVPTTNIILKWNRRESGAHLLDENLSEIALITKDAFEPMLPLAVVGHIDYRKAPLVVQRFGDVKRLVEQTLDPMVAAYFKNIGQTRTLIQLIQDRSTIQSLASEQMREKFDRYNLELEEVLIGTPASPQGDTQIEDILNQLRSRQIAEEQIETYARQERAAVKERELREAEARARQQQMLTESELSITVQSNQGKAEYQRALQQAAQIRALAEADAERTARLGIAEAIAIEEKVRAYGGPQFQVTQQVMNRFAEAVETAKIDLVPRIAVGGGGNGSSGQNLMEGLLAMLLAERAGQDLVSNGVNATRPEVAAMRGQILQRLMEDEPRAQPSDPSARPQTTTGKR